MELLRFFTAGNVDDGKSTLIGRLLYDSNSISTDIIETLTRQSKTTGNNTTIDLALLTDGLRAEREQGITIDVAYKYFSTEKRKFIIADTPGHIQYTRNMFTGSSNSDLAIILIDARHGVTEQTKRHSILSSIIGVPHIVICINKMDMVDYSEAKFNEIKESYLQFAESLNLEDIHFIPISALLGDNVVTSSSNMNWYHDKPLLPFLEEIEIKSKRISPKGRFQVQYVIRPQTEELHDYRGYAGSIFGGNLSTGQKVKVYPGELETTIEKIEKDQSAIQKANYFDPIILHLKDDLDVSRGNWIVPFEESILSTKEVRAILLWMDNSPFVSGQKLLLQQNSFLTKAKISEITTKINIHDYSKMESDNILQLNELGEVLIKIADNLYYDLYSENHNTGSFILLNENTNNTVGAGIILGS
jgi:sulfate adenylyltransferase subunit 1